jgi:hypothetical protein
MTVDEQKAAEKKFDPKGHHRCGYVLEGTVTTPIKLCGAPATHYHAHNIAKLADCDYAYGDSFWLCDEHEPGMIAEHKDVDRASDSSNGTREHRFAAIGGRARMEGSR